MDLAVLGDPDKAGSGVPREDHRRRARLLGPGPATVAGFQETLWPGAHNVRFVTRIDREAIQWQRGTGLPDATVGRRHEPSTAGIPAEDAAVGEGQAMEVDLSR